MTPADFRRIALSFEGVEEVSHAGLPAFRVGDRRLLRWPPKPRATET